VEERDVKEKQKKDKRKKGVKAGEPQTKHAAQVKSAGAATEKPAENKSENRSEKSETKSETT
jgi:hypothetical protein